MLLLLWRWNPLFILRIDCNFQALFRHKSIPLSAQITSQERKIPVIYSIISANTCLQRNNKEQHCDALQLYIPFSSYFSLLSIDNRFFTTAAACIDSIHENQVNLEKCLFRCFFLFLSFVLKHARFMNLQKFSPEDSISQITMGQHSIIRLSSPR